MVITLFYGHDPGSPVVRAGSVRGYIGVGIIIDMPCEASLGAKADGGPVAGIHVVAAGVEVTQDESILGDAIQAVM